MTKSRPPKGKNRLLIGAICSSISLASLPMAAVAESPQIQLNNINSVSETMLAQGVNQRPVPVRPESPLTRVNLPGNRVNVRLINKTGTTLNYQAIGHTNYRSLPTEFQDTLRNLPAPSTIMLDRPDGGHMRFTTRSQPGFLEIYIYPQANFDDNKGVLEIQPTGLVYVSLR